MLNNKLVLVFYSRFCDCALGHRMVECATTGKVDGASSVPRYVKFICLFCAGFCAILINNAGTTKYKLYTLIPCALCFVPRLYGCLAPWTKLFCSIKDSTDQYCSHARCAINHFHFEPDQCVWLRNIIYSSLQCILHAATCHRESIISHVNWLVGVRTEHLVACKLINVFSERTMRSTINPLNRKEKRKA